MSRKGMFNGSDYDPNMDDPRLWTQLNRIKEVMLDGKWRTLSEIEHLTGAPTASISAQLRHLRKQRFGSYTVEKKVRSDRRIGLYEYRLLRQGSPNGKKTKAGNEA